MLVIIRLRAAMGGEFDDGKDVGAELHSALAVLAAEPGYLDGHVAHNVDEQGLWVLVTRWRDVGSYRRALSSYDVRVGVVPLLAGAVDEPSAYEIIEPGGQPNTVRPRQTW